MKSSKKVKGSAHEDGGTGTPRPPPVYVNVPPGALVTLFALTAGLAFTTGWLANRPAARDAAPARAPERASASPKPATSASPAQGPSSELTTASGRLVTDDPRAGRLELIPLLVTPSPDSIEELAWVTHERSWHLRGMDRAGIEKFFRACGLDEAERAALWKTARSEGEARADVFNFSPPDELVRGFSRDARFKLYVRLGEEDDNLDQVNAYHAPTDDLDAWLAPAELPDDTLRAIKSLCYQNQHHWLFADLSLVVSRLGDAERRRLLEALSTQRSWLVRLHVDEQTDVEALARYYGRGGRADTLRPYLRALKRIPGGTWISLRALLPPFVQNHLNLFPKPSEDPIARARDCHWTALNFFNDPPDDRFAGDHQLVLPELARNYHRVNADFRLGDVVLFLTREKGSEQARYFHAAVYVAPEILFAKNGRRPTSPWMFMRPDDARAWYPRSQEVIELTYRRNDLSD